MQEKFEQRMRCMSRDYNRKFNNEITQEKLFVMSQDSEGPFRNVFDT